MGSDLIMSVNQICAERGLEPDDVFTALKQAIGEAYRKEKGEETKVAVEIDKQSGQFNLYVIKQVVKRVTNELTEISAEDAKLMSKEVKAGDELQIEVPVGILGRIAAQTAKHVILGKIRDAERMAMVAFYQPKKGEIISGKVQSVRNDTIVVELEKGIGEMPEAEQINGEFYEIGKRYRFLLKELINEENNRHIILSRKDEKFVKSIFAMEVPEILNDQIEIRDIAREAGTRCKVAVFSNVDGLDPVGACIGQRAMRITAIQGELNEEKVDVVEWKMDPVRYLEEALGKSTVAKIVLDEKSQTAIAYVPNDKLSLAVGRDGSNVRLASKLTGYVITIKDIAEEEKDKEIKAKSTKIAEEKPEKAAKVTAKVTKKTVAKKAVTKKTTTKKSAIKKTVSKAKVVKKTTAKKPTKVTKETKTVKKVIKSKVAKKK